MSLTPSEKTLVAKLEVINDIEGFVGDHLSSLLRPVDQSWQPSDFLPDMSRTDWREQITDLQKRAESLSNELLVVLVGDMVTEEALPTYQTTLNRLEGIADPTGASERPWAQWSRGWTSEENRHGDLLNRYLYLTGRVDMRAIEVTIQYLLKEGFDPKIENDPYLGFVYTSFQERATKISHRNVASLAARAGEDTLNRICGFIAGDESRHEKAYKLFMAKVFEHDPAGAVTAFATMMKRKIVMPAARMRDTADEQLFAKFSAVAQRLGVYTAQDYANIIDDLVHHWDVPHLPGLSDLAARAQDYLCTLADRYRALTDRLTVGTAGSFSWLFGKPVGG